MAKLKDTTIVGGGSDKTLQIVNPQLQEVLTIDTEGVIRKPEGSNIGIGLRNNTPFYTSSIATTLYSNQDDSIWVGRSQAKLLYTFSTSNFLENYIIILTLTQFASIRYTGRIYLCKSTTAEAAVSETGKKLIGTVSAFGANEVNGEIGSYTITQNDLSNNRKYIYIIGDYNDGNTNGQLFIRLKQAGAAASNSIAIGNNAAARVSKSVSIGYNAGTSAPTNMATTNINCKGRGSSKITMGVGDTALIYNNGTAGWSAASDIRDKADIMRIENGLEFINNLNPVTFVYNRREEYCENPLDISTFNSGSHDKGELKGERRHSGFIAQEVYQTLKDIYKNDNYAAIIDYNFYDGNIEDEFERYSIQITAIIPFLVKANQELSEKIDKLNKRIDELEKNK